jgi:hypothetical protein
MRVPTGCVSVFHGGTQSWARHHQQVDRMISASSTRRVALATPLARPRRLRVVRRVLELVALVASCRATASLFADAAVPVSR